MVSIAGRSVAALADRPAALAPALDLRAALAASCRAVPGRLAGRADSRSIACVLVAVRACATSQAHDPRQRPGRRRAPPQDTGQPSSCACRAIMRRLAAEGSRAAWQTTTSQRWCRATAPVGAVHQFAMANVRRRWLLQAEQAVDRLGREA